MSQVQSEREKDFEAGFEEQIEDMLIFAEKKPTNGYSSKGYREIRYNYIAVWNMQADKPEHSFGELIWIEKDIPLIHKFHFKGMQAYHVRVRKSKKFQKHYMVCSMEKVTGERFERLKEEAQKPITITGQLGTFEWNKELLYFKGEIDYLGETRNIWLNTDNGELMADSQLERLNGIYRQLEKWDLEIKEFAAEDLLELANEWREDRDEITKEEFIQRIGTPDITINADMSMVFTFDCDEMFTDHAIEIYVDENDNITGSDIVG